jgi:CBS domain containing-hemolysin-like protein
MAIRWAGMVMAIGLSLAAAAAAALRSSLLVLGEEGLAEEGVRGDKTAALLLSAVKDPSLRHPFALWTAVSLLKTCSAVSAGAAALALAREDGLRGAAFGAAWIGVYLLLLFFLENVANGEAMESPRRILRWGGRLCIAALRISAGPARLLDRLGRFLFGDRYSPEALMEVRIASEEGILDVIEEGAERGTIDPTEEKLIEGVLRFGEATVSEAMTPKAEVVFLKEGMPDDEVAGIVGETGFSRYPVLSASGDEVVGILHSLGLFRPPRGERWERLLEKPVYIPESMKAADLFRRIQRSRVHTAVVIDEHGKLCGLVTVHDLLEKILGRMSTVIGPVEGPEWEKDGALSVPGITPVRVLREEYDIGIPLSANYETAGGFAMDYLQKVPEGATTFLAHGYRITVAETDRYRIRSLRIEKVPLTGTS